MPSLVVRNLDETLVKALKARAASHHRSAEAEHRAILADVLMKPQRKSFAKVISSIPNVGLDSDFQRVNEDADLANVFD